MERDAKITRASSRRQAVVKRDLPVNTPVYFSKHPIERKIANTPESSQNRHFQTISGLLSSNQPLSEPLPPTQFFDNAESSILNSP